jgi:cell division septum initiation protein DivIVA
MSSTGDPISIRQDIEATREELGETVEALAAKTDVTGQAKRKLDETKAAVSEKADDVFGKAREATPDTAAGMLNKVLAMARRNPVPFIAGALVIGLVIGRRSGD